MENGIHEIITTRRTSKTSLTKAVSPELIIQLLAKASFAPFHKKEPWQAKIITTLQEKEFLFEKVIATLKRNGTIFDEETHIKFTTKMTRLLKEAPATIIFAREIIPDNPRLDMDSIQATAALIQNFSLLAWEADLVGFWASSAFIMDEQLATELGFPPNYQIIANYRLGYRDLDKKISNARRQPVETWAKALDYRVDS